MSPDLQSCILTGKELRDPKCTVSLTLRPQILSRSVPYVLSILREEAIVHEAAWHRHLKLFLEYDHGTRTHLSLEKDPPERRSVEPPESGRVVAVPQVGGLHHRYERRRLNRGVMSSAVTAPPPLPRSHRGAVAALDPGAKPV